MLQAAIHVAPAVNGVEGCRARYVMSASVTRLSVPRTNRPYATGAWSTSVCARDAQIAELHRCDIGDSHNWIAVRTSASIEDRRSGRGSGQRQVLADARDRVCVAPSVHARADAHGVTTTCGIERGVHRISDTAIRTDMKGLVKPFDTDLVCAPAGAEVAARVHGAVPGYEICRAKRL